MPPEPPRKLSPEALGVADAEDLSLLAHPGRRLVDLEDPMVPTTNNRVRRATAVLGLLIFAVLAVACGEDAGPAAPTPPTPPVPQVGGAYSGQVVMSPHGNVWIGFARTVVVQAGTGVTITGSIELDGHTVAVEMGGTIDATGRFTRTAGEAFAAALVDYRCGAQRLTVAVLIFSAGMFNFSETWTTTECGTMEVTGWGRP